VKRRRLHHAKNASAQSRMPVSLLDVLTRGLPVRVLLPGLLVRTAVEVLDRLAQLEVVSGTDHRGGGPGRAWSRRADGFLADRPDGWLQGQRLALPAGGGELVLDSGTRAFAEPVGHAEAFIVRTLAARGTARRPQLLKLSLLGRDRADAELGGRPIDLSRRHSEVLALLSMRPVGMTTDELSADLYGDRGTPSTTRVEVHRLRKLMGAWIDTDPDRLSNDLESDVARVQGLLDRGAIREAVEHYEGPLLPHSEAPGVVREREALDGWVRQAVMTSDDDEALWAWVQSASGEDDFPAWSRLLVHLDFRDPRRSLAAARVGALRAARAAT
jgi:hypothetical protein